MGTTTKNSITSKKKVVVDKTVKNYSNDPFFIKKEKQL